MHRFIHPKTTENTGEVFWSNLFHNRGGRKDLTEESLAKSGITASWYVYPKSSSISQEQIPSLRRGLSKPLSLSSSPLLPESLSIWDSAGTNRKGEIVLGKQDRAKVAASRGMKKKKQAGEKRCEVILLGKQAYVAWRCLETQNIFYCADLEWIIRVK